MQEKTLWMVLHVRKLGTETVQYAFEAQQKIGEFEKVSEVNSKGKKFEGVVFRSKMRV